MSITVDFRVDASASLGIGHVVRCCALAEALSRTCDVVCRFSPDALRLAQRILEKFSLRIASDSAYEKAVIVVTDTGTLDAAECAELRRLGQLVVSIDDFPPAVSCVDILVQPNSLVGEVPKGVRVFLGGPEFILLHPAYTAVEVLPLNVSVRRVLACFGGSDPADLSSRLVTLLESTVVNADFRLILGPLYQGSAMLRATSVTSGLTLLDDVNVLAEEMAACDLAIVSGGTLAYEACALGRPTVVISQNQDQASEAEFLATAGAVVHVGRHDTVSDEAIILAIDQLSSDYSRRFGLSALASRLIPRDGAERVAARILNCPAIMRTNEHQPRVRN